MRAGALALLALVLPVAAAAQPGCNLGSRTIARMADLPPGATAALGFNMAERGQPFQATDDIAPGPRLPGSRYMAARQEGYGLTIRYERGGIARAYNRAILERRGNGWVVLRRE